jgi:hypothetical protein
MEKSERDIMEKRNKTITKRGRPVIENEKEKKRKTKNMENSWWKYGNAIQPKQMLATPK